MAENLGLKYKTLSYTNAIVCNILKINLMLHFFLRRTSMKHPQKVHYIPLSLWVRSFPICLLPIF